MQQMQETWFQSLVWEDPLKKEMATHSSILAWKNLMLKGSWWVTDHGVTKSQTWLSTCQQQHGLIILLLMLHVQLYRDYKRTLQKYLKKFTYVVFVLNKLLSIFKVRSLQKFALFINVCACVLVAQSCPPLCNPMDCSPPGFSVYEIFPGKNTGVGSHFLLQGMFPNQGSNPHLLCWQADSLLLSHQGR